jgi:hypothetical protein
MTPAERVAQTLAQEAEWLDQLLADHLHRIENTFSDVHGGG